MSEARKPHVVMIVGNDIATDTRVRKMGVAMTRLGARVTIVCYTADKVPKPSHIGEVDVVRVHVPFRLRAAQKARLEDRRPPHRLSDTYVLQYDAKRIRLTLRKQDAAERGGPLAPLRVNWYRGLLKLTRIRRRLRVQAMGYGRQAWKNWDAMVSRIPYGATWQRLLPDMDDYLIRFQAVIESLQPDVIHCHDVHMMRVADRVTKTMAVAGKSVPWVYDAHEYVRGLSQTPSRPPRRIAAFADLEKSHIRSAARVMTVSPELSRRLQRQYSLKRLPDVVLNIPQPPESVPHDAPTLRTRIGLPPDTPLLVYSGMMAAVRGIDTAAAALEYLPGVHLVFVCVPGVHVAQAFRAEVATKPYASRVHFVEPVAPMLVPHYLSSADLGLLPLRHFGSHEVALANKLFEYMHAGLPIVVSDCAAQKQFVNEQRIGTVHVAGDARDLARAVNEALATIDELRARVRNEALLHEYSWNAQEARLHDVYRELLPGAGFLPVSIPAPGGEPAELPGLAGANHADHRTVLGIGPANSAGQAWQWMKAVERHSPDMATEVLTVRAGAFGFNTDLTVSPDDFAKDSGWQTRHSLHALTTYTHVLLEAARPLFGTLNGNDFTGDAGMLQAAGKVVGLVFHGSEVRNPRAHAATCPTSPFRNPKDPETARLQMKFDQVIDAIREFEGPKFVSTPDQLDYVPDATWLPVVVPTEGLPATSEPLQRDVPVVVHAPSRKSLKGTDEIEGALQPLIDEGLITYRRIENVPAAEVMGFLADADIVIDQVLLGIYGVLSCEGMVLGRLVVGRADAGTRDRVPREIPIVDVTPSTLCATMREILANRGKYQAIAAEGPGFVREFHDGRRSAEVLRAFTDLRA